MHIALILLWIANAVDAAGTYFFIHRGVAREANPIMLWCIERGWWVFFVAKFSLISGSSALLWNKPWRGIVKTTVLFLLAVYSLICLWHGYGAYLVLTGEL